MRDKRKLDRLLRVRTLQLGLVRIEEARAHERLASEAALRSRIADLARSVAPTVSADDALSFIAAAHFRERLGQSAASAEQRVRRAEEERDRASEATREAKRDQSAIEKLKEREVAREIVKAVRSLEEVPAFRKNRHDIC